MLTDGYLPCCDPLVECLGDWNLNDNYHYLCKTSCDEAADEPDRMCTEENQDPHSFVGRRMLTDGYWPCCDPLVECVGDWNLNGNYHYLCKTSCDADNDETTPPVVEDETTPPVVEDETMPPVVEDETTPPVVEDETTPPVVEDETTPPVVEDETTPPVVEDETMEPTTVNERDVDAFFEEFEASSSASQLESVAISLISLVMAIGLSLAM
jgi:hypothetical protein